VPVPPLFLLADDILAVASDLPFLAFRRVIKNGLVLFATDMIHWLLPIRSFDILFFIRVDERTTWVVGIECEVKESIQRCVCVEGRE
jgi:hypothetical protein